MSSRYSRHDVCERDRIIIGSPLFPIIIGPQRKTAAALMLMLLCIVIAGFFPATAAETSRPRIGLVLGGGGARGVAHIGVIRVLEEMRIPIDCIAGTSMGSLVGGVYAAGVTVDEMTERLAVVDWRDIFTDDPPRNEKPYRAKRDDYENLFRLELGQRGSELLLPTGTTAGYKFEFLLREMVAGAGNFADQDFDTLPIPYRAVATNIENGTRKEFSHGDLVKAMRASMSVPGAIAPVEIDGVLYVDGGLVENVPVSAARKACADVVIVVNVGSGLLPRDQLNSALGVTLQMVNVLMEQNVRVSLDSLRTGDVLIEPALGDFSSADFEDSLSLIPVGEAAARDKAAALRALSVPEADYQAWRESVAARLPEVPAVTDVQVVSTGDSVNAEVVERELASRPGIDLKGRPETDFSLENLNTRLEQVYGRGDYERMDYRMIDSDGTRTVEVQGVEKSWGPNYIKFGLELAADLEQTRFNINASHRMTWLNDLGGEWRNDLTLGYVQRFASEFYQPTSLTSGLFVAPWVELGREPIVYFIDESRVGDTVNSYARAHLDAGVQNKYGQLRFGPFAGQLKSDPDFGVLNPLIEGANVTQVGYTGSITFDQIDSPAFARDGVLARVSTFGTSESLGSQDDYNKTELFLLGAKAFGKHSIQLAGYVGQTLYGDLPDYDPFQLGGFLRGSGYQMDELIGENVFLGRAVYTYQVGSLPPAIGRGVYLGGSAEITRASLGIEVEGDATYRPSASLFVGVDTFLGPLYLAYGQAFGAQDGYQFYLLLGSP